MTEFYGITITIFIVASIIALLVFNETDRNDDHYDYEGENDQ